MRSIAFVLLVLPVIAHANWSYEEQIDAFSDDSKYLAYTTSTTDRNGAVMVNCINGSLAIVLKIGAHHVPAGFPQPVMEFRYRVDKGEIVETDGIFMEGSFVMTSGSKDFQKLLPALQAGQVLSAELTDYRAIAKRHHFSLKGSSAAIRKVVNACSR